MFDARLAPGVANSSFVAQQKPEQVISWVADADDSFATYNAGSDRTILMRYESHTKDHTLVHQMLDFLGLDYDPDLIEQIFAKPLTHAPSPAEQQTGF